MTMGTISAVPPLPSVHSPRIKGVALDIKVIGPSLRRC